MIRSKNLVLCGVFVVLSCFLRPLWAFSEPYSLPSFANLVEAEGQTVVNIRATVRSPAVGGRLPPLPGDFSSFFEDWPLPFQFPSMPGPRNRTSRSAGSGFIISEDGYILTNAHVVAKAEDVSVTLKDRRSFQAQVIGSDARTDIALLKIDARGLPTVRVGRPELLRVGDWVVAIGSPFGFEQTVTAGIVSAKGRKLPSESYVPFIQTDVAVNPGNSGGPLFALNGEVVGINSQIYSRSGGFMGISFAIPIDEAMAVVGALKRYGRVNRGRLGISVQEMSAELANSFGLQDHSGALIGQVERGGPAARAGLRSGDVVLSLDDQKVESPYDLVRLISSIPVGEQVDIEIWRDRQIYRLTVKTEALDDKNGRVGSESSQKRGKKTQDPQRRTVSQLGIEVVELRPAQLKELGVAYGVLVMSVNSSVSGAGLTVGDLIVGVGTQKVENFSKLESEVNKYHKRGRSAIPLHIYRKGATVFLPVPLGSALKPKN